MSHPDQQPALARPPCLPEGRHKAPSGVPRSTTVRLGGEGTPPRAVVECPPRAPEAPAAARVAALPSLEA